MILHNIHFIHLIIDVRQWQLFLSKLKILQQHWDKILTYWKQWECDNFGLGRIRTFGFDVFTKTDERDSRLISVWKPSLLTFGISSTKLSNTFTGKSASEGKENQKVKALICTNHSVHD